MLSDPLVKGIIGLKEIGRLSRLGGKTIGLYLMTTLVSVVIGVTLCQLVRPGRYFNQEKVVQMQDAYRSNVEQQSAAAASVQQKGPLNFIEELVPDNFLLAASNNGKMLQVIFFAVLFALAALVVGRQKIEPIIRLFDALNDVFLKMVDLIIKTAPYGVAALMAGLMIDFAGDASMFGALALYAVTVVAAMALLALGFYPLLIHLFTKKKVKDFLKIMYPVQLVAFTTSSSSATLPLTLETVEKELGVSTEVASFVLPMGATINMDGTSCFQAISVLFIAQAVGVELSFVQLLLIILLTIVSSIGTPGVPGGSFVILTMVLSSVGIPAEGLALVLGIDRPLDMLRTSVNVTGDATVSLLVDGTSDKPI